MIAQQQSSSHQQDFLGALTTLAMAEEAGLEPAGGMSWVGCLRRLKVKNCLWVAVSGLMLVAMRQRGTYSGVGCVDF